HHPGTLFTRNDRGLCRSRPREGRRGDDAIGMIRDSPGVRPAPCLHGLAVPSPSTKADTVSYSDILPDVPKVIESVYCVLSTSHSQRNDFIVILKLIIYCLEKYEIITRNASAGQEGSDGVRLFPEAPVTTLKKLDKLIGKVVHRWAVDEDESLKEGESYFED